MKFLIGIIVYTANHGDGGRSEVRRTKEGYHIVAYDSDNEIEGSQPGPKSLAECKQIADDDDPTL